MGVRQLDRRCFSRAALGLIGALLFWSPVAAQDRQTTPAPRIVSIGGDVTEIIYALGKGDLLAATDSTSVYPAAAAETPKVGYVRRLSAEGVLAMEPDLIVISGAAGPPAAVEQLRAAGVDIVEMEARYSVEGVVAKTRKVAAALGEAAAGEALVDRLENDAADVRKEIAALGLSPSVLFFATLGDGAPRAAGRDTAAHGVIELLGGRNVFGSETGYKALSLEAAVAANPDIILVMRHHAASIGGLDAVAAHPALALTDAAKTGRIFEVDQVAVMQFGPRTPAATLKLAREISAAVGAR